MQEIVTEWNVERLLRLEAEIFLPGGNLEIPGHF
jgi:hypothetical protein